MDITLYLILGTLLIFLGGKDLAEAWIKFRKEGKSITKSIAEITPMFILPWPRTVNKRLIWIGAGCFFVCSAVQQFIVRFL